MSSVRLPVPSHCLRTRCSHVAPVVYPRLPAHRIGRTPRIRSCAAKKTAKTSNAEPQVKAGPKPPPAEQAASEDSTDEQDSAVPLLTAAERTLQALQVGDPLEAEALAQETVQEVQSLAAAVEQTEAESKASAATLATLKDQYRRLQADFDNFRSRADTEKAQIGKRVKMSIVEDMLPLVDNFELASAQVVPATQGEEKINTSYQGLYRQMVEIFRGMGLEAVPTEGVAFDPALHDAVMKEDSHDVEDGTILQEFRKGFTFSGQLLRPAMVKVASNSGGVANDASAPKAASTSDDRSGGKEEAPIDEASTKA